MTQNDDFFSRHNKQEVKHLNHYFSHLRRK